jgi:hypothetical protein
MSIYSIKKKEKTNLKQLAWMIMEKIIYYTIILEHLNCL